MTASKLSNDELDLTYYAVAQFQFSQQSYNVTEDEKFVPVCLDFVNYATERVTKNITFTLEYYNIGSGK